MVLLQLLGEEVLLGCYSSVEMAESLDHYSSVCFEFNVVYGLLLLVNYLARRKLVIEDERVLRSFRTGIHLEFQGIPDVLGILLSANYVLQALTVIQSLCP